MVQLKKLNDMSNTNGTSKYRDQQSNMSFQRGGNRNDGRVQNGNSPSFRTDSAISGNRAQGERVLQKWVPDAPEDVDNSLESSHNSSGAVWDQFAENERRFGLKTDYDENIYTTAIDKNHPLYRQRLAEADRKAKEIERSTATNSHVAEERITDNVKPGNNSVDEEAKYSSVARQDFPPLLSSNNKYTPPARRAPTAQATVSGAPVDPAIISSQLARPDKPAADKAKPTPKTSKPDVSTPPAAAAPGSKAPVEVKPTPKTEAKVTPSKTIPANTSTSITRTASPNVQLDGVRNATATVERDVASAFKVFAGQQRRNVEQVRQTKARNDKEVKLNDLKKFADTFKLNTPVPADLVGIIAKDPAKQKEIQEKAKRNAEEAKSNSSDAVKPIPSQPDTRSGQRPTAVNVGSSPAGVPSRQNPGRGAGVSHQGAYNSNSYRSGQGQPTPAQQGHPTGGLASRLRNGPQQKHAQAPVTPIPQPPFVPTGPAMGMDPNASRRSSGVNSAQGARLNPNSNEFRPNAFAPTFTPNGNPSATSSPLSSGNTAVEQHQTPPVSRSLLKRKPIPEAQRPSIKGKFNALDNIKAIKPGPGQTWDKFGGVKPAYNTPPTWKQPGDKDDAKSAIHKTYTSIFEEAPFPAQQPMSPINQSHAVPQVPHQHQLPFHLQQQNMHPRQSPRQPPTHLHHNHGPNPSFSGPDDHHRMMPSLSAQSAYASPRLQSVPIAFPSPMGQPAQMFNGQQMMQYPPQMTRQFSQGQQFIPQPAHMGAPGMMMQNPANGFMGPQGMAPGPQMMYPPGQGHFMPPGGGPPGMPMNGYPSPGRSAPMMMNQGSQQGHPGQPVYGMSPSQQYGQMAPMYAQQQPGQMPMRGYGGPQQFGTSPQQMHQYGGQHRNHQNGNYNNSKNFQQSGQHPNPSPNNQVPTGPQAQPSEAVDEAK